MSTLCNYDLLEPIGEGAGGVVYRARHRALDRLVAIKLLRARSLDAADQARFRQEARLAASLDHPHIVPLYEVGQDEGGFFLVMKLIEGTDLKKSADWMRLYPRKVAQVMASVARAVQHAHERGVLHRDLKTSNILMDADAQPHLIDFGLARPLEGGAYLMATSVIVGTPAYLSPEQAAGCKQIGPAADIWALGVILHELLTGKLPFEGGTTYAVLLAIQSSPVALSQRASSDLERTCLRCLQKKPADRYLSAAELAEDLERVSEGERLNRTWRDRGTTFLRWAARLAPVAAALVLVAIVLMPLLARWELDGGPEKPGGRAPLADYPDENDPEAVVKITDADLASLRDNGLLHRWVMAREGLRKAFGTVHSPGMTHDDQITRLDLEGSRITHAGLKHLAGLKKLTYLGLTENQVTDEVLGALAQNGQIHTLPGAEGPHNPNRMGPVPAGPLRRFASESDAEIVSLQLQGTRITDAGLKHLAGLKNLQVLDLSNTKVTRAKVQELQAALPRCRIVVP